MDKATNKPKPEHTNEGAAFPTYSQVESPQRIKSKPIWLKNYQEKIS